MQFLTAIALPARQAGLATAVAILLFLPATALASYPQLLYRHNHHLFFLQPDDSWRKTEEVWRYDGLDIAPPSELRVDGDTLPDLPAGVIRSLVTVWDIDAIERIIIARIATTIDRPRGEVTIRREGEDIVFEGVGLTGKEVDTHRAALLTAQALERGVTDIHLPVRESQPVIRVPDTDLQDRGIREVLSVGESDFSGSPKARIHNINTGLLKFNGHTIAQGEEFSFNDVLGPVNGQTGYLKELVILGEQTLPDYGGGLCQVSTTAYRGIWEHGFPITDRRNHSFAVGYYSPQGTDATIYPPSTDLKFLNDGPSDILIQTHMENDRAYFIYYGTRDGREVEVIGPYIWNRRGPPPDRIEYTQDLPEGVRKSVGKAVSGMQSAWFRIVRDSGGLETIEPFYSHYEARPNYTLIGGIPPPPGWIGFDE